MGTWLELRCEARTEIDYSNGDFKNRCWSDDNSGPMRMSEDKQQSILAALKSMKAEAIKTGWVKKRQGWVCPRCISLEKKEEVA